VSKQRKHNPSPPAAASAPHSAETDFELVLEDTLAQKSRGLAVKGSVRGIKAIKAVGGYNPYDAAPGSKPAPVRPAAAAQLSEDTQPQRKPTDLRKLSEWIRLQRQVEALKHEKPEPE